MPRFSKYGVDCWNRFKTAEVGGQVGQFSELGGVPYRAVLIEAPSAPLSAQPDDGCTRSQLPFAIKPEFVGAIKVAWEWTSRQDVGVLRSRMRWAE